MRFRVGIRAIFFALTLAACAQAAPYTPSQDDEVLERLPRGIASIRSSDRRGRMGSENRSQLLDDALGFARSCILHSRAESDPRFLGHAQAALAPWWNLPRPPTDVLVLRAIIRQSNHEFAAALADLGDVLKADPDHAQAWLTRAMIHQVLGDYDEARRCALTVARLCSPLVAATCASSLASLTGEAQRAYETLGATVTAGRAEPIEVRLWAFTVLAEIAARLGKTAEAESHFARALKLDQRDGYLLGAYADFLLDQERATEVIRLLNGETRADALLLRLALAEKEASTTSQLAHENFPAHVKELSDRFAASRLRGDAAHLREEARFNLDLLDRPAEAVRCARQNWLVQREPADLRILLDAAIRANDRATAVAAEDWIQRHKLQDARLTASLRALHAQR